ncbi:hypothetical protein A9Q84_13535 [Halobacteriovorax marinus]|uniref:S-adenosylmethionine-dependent methyltransferase domain-containing protein n=1 Tax=Halobacteriovorax marinus TaxID=97084 RepID=A0A1Y5FD19_9BACT|nr:hypothetical protein A9Q84_13535 [Halobacteriovorax marinus]
MSEIKNKLLKNLKHRRKWAKKNQFEAYRLYDKEIPQYPYLIDIYKDKVIIFDRRIDKIDEAKPELYDEMITAICEIFEMKSDDIIIKKRIIQTKEDKYEKFDSTNNRFEVKEKDAVVLVNLIDYIDTGLFLDHRPMRLKLNATSKDKSLLNLFCYTSVVSVQAALGGAITTNVDMSKTYIQWSQDNFEANDIPLKDHEFINADVFKFMNEYKEKKFDIIFLDPPTFSNSKRMSNTLDILRDHGFLIERCMKLLNEDGILYFSNNKRGFRLDPKVSELFDVKDISFNTIPEDFKDKKIHVCFEIKKK